MPVYLWTHGLGLAGLSLLIGTSGVTFALSLRLWQYLSSHWSLKQLVTLTFALEIALVVAVGLLSTVPGMPLFQSPSETPPTNQNDLIAAAMIIGGFNGLYNAFFWTTQRTLFLQQLGQNDTGRQYGNFQIFVTLFLKVGILMGGFLLDNGGFIWLLAISAGFSAASHLWLARFTESRQHLHPPVERIKTRQSLQFSDNRGSRPAFAIDGIFLYLESHFWTLSLFLVVKQDFSKLGIAVVLLALGFAVLFFLIKNRIDHLAIEQVYRAAVYLYALSWLLRFTLDDESQGATLMISLLVITFFSSFFRLAFNKRFFDVARDAASGAARDAARDVARDATRGAARDAARDAARREGALQYLLIKSYSSQWILGLFFMLTGILLVLFPTDTQLVLKVLYLAAAFLSIVYLSYRDKPVVVIAT